MELSISYVKGSLSFGLGPRGFLTYFHIVFSDGRKEAGLSAPLPFVALIGKGSAGVRGCGLMQAHGNAPMHSSPGQLHVIPGMLGGSPTGLS